MPASDGASTEPTTIDDGDDIDEAKQLMLEAIHSVNGVLKDPAPDVLVMDLQLPDITGAEATKETAGMVLTDGGAMLRKASFERVGVAGVIGTICALLEIDVE